MNRIMCRCWSFVGTAGATRFVPVRDIRNVREWLDDYMLGQIWAMGQIEEILEDI